MSVVKLTLPVRSRIKSLFCGDRAPAAISGGGRILAGFPSTGPPGPNSFTLHQNNIEKI